MSVYNERHVFDRISNLGIFLGTAEYDPDIEHVLRFNHARKKFICSDGEVSFGGGSSCTTTARITPTINYALWH